MSLVRELAWSFVRPLIAMLVMSSPSRFISAMELSRRVLISWLEVVSESVSSGLSPVCEGKSESLVKALS